MVPVDMQNLRILYFYHRAQIPMTGLTVTVALFRLIKEMVYGKSQLITTVR